MTDTLNNRIRHWRKEMAYKHGLFAHELDELEDHLRTELKHDISSVQASTHGGPTEQVEYVITQLGEPNTLVRELKQVRKKNIQSFLVGWSVFAILALIATNRMTTSGSLLIYVDMNAVLLVVGFLSAGLMMTYHPRQIGRAFKLGLLRHPPDCLDDLIESQGVLHRGRQLCWASAIVSLAAGTMFYLVQVGDFHALGQSLALAILGGLFAVCLAELFFASQLQLLHDRRAQIESAAMV